MKISNPETQALFDALARNTREMIVVPNSWLPEEYHNNRDGGRSLQELSDMATVKMETETQHQKLKREKSERAESYRKQWENSETPLDYDEDSDKLYRNQLTFVGVMIKTGVMEEFDE
jgi:hypothetical protein